MQLLIFKVSEELYGLDFLEIVEVIPLVKFRPVPHVPASVAGIFKYRGSIVPSIDLSILFAGEPSKNMFSTRIIIIKNDGRYIGLIAENVTESIACKEDDLIEPGIIPQGAKYLGKMLKIGDSFVQKIVPSKLFPDELIEILANSVIKNEI